MTGRQPGNEGCIFGGQLKGFLQSCSHICQAPYILPPFHPSATPLQLANMLLTQPDSQALQVLCSSVDLTTSSGKHAKQQRIVVRSAEVWHG